MKSRNYKFFINSRKVLAKFTGSSYYFLYRIHIEIRAPGDGVIQKGDILFSRYRIEELLGTGAFGEVYLAEHLNLKVNRALKCISKYRDVYRTAVREADILKDLRHPAIPIIYDIEENDECVCIIEEYVEGLSLSSLLSDKGKLPVRHVVNISLELCKVVQYLHGRGIFHRDIKPENIIYNGRSIKLLDYGNAVCAGSISAPAMGTKWYAAPEMYTGNASDAGGDIYSIGAVMLAAAAGKMDIERLNGVRPREFAEIVRKCLLHSKRERFGSVAELGHALSKIYGNKSVSDIVSLRIAFAGAYPHCGTTHCSLIAARVLSKTGFTAVAKECNQSRDFMEIIKTAERVVFDRGVYSADGINMIPDYGGCAATEYEDRFDRIICDYGCAAETNLDEIIRADYVCLVTGAKPYELKRTAEITERLLNELPGISKRLRTIINFAGGIRAGVFAERGIVNPVRICYQPEPYKYHCKGFASEYGKKKHRFKR